MSQIVQPYNNQGAVPGLPTAPAGGTIGRIVHFVLAALHRLGEFDLDLYST